MATTKLMLIRHAEKPNGAQGVMPDGSQNAEALVVQGWQRAGALVGLFAPPGGRFANPLLATPRTIIATGIAHHSESLRPQQTVTPLAAKLNVQLNTTFPKGEESAMVNAAVAAGGIVLIAWQHEDIPSIAGLILVGSSGVPQKWPGDRFDLVWIFDRPSGAGNWSFNQVPQLLLAGDSATTIAAT
jgi:hypothetical protein